MPKIQSSDAIHEIHVNGVDVLNNEIYLVGEETYNSGAGVDEAAEPGVEYIMSSRFIKNLNILCNNSDNPITIHMKTNGGHWGEGMAIYDAIKSCKNEITIINYTHARSMSSLIFLAADKRVMMPHSVYMIHEGTIHTGGTVRQFRTEFEQNEKAMEQMMNIYIKHLSKQTYWKDSTESQIKSWLIKNMKDREEFYMSAEEAVEYGFADEIMHGYD